MIRDWRLPRALLHVLFATLCVSILASCSLVRIGYPQLDTIAEWTADKYFDLDPQQKHEFLARFDRLHEWHRYEQLPEYASFLASAKARLQKRLSHEDVIWFAEGLKQRYRTIVRRGAPDAAALLATITPEQLDALQRRFDKDNRRFVREYRLEAGPEERKQARARRALSQIRDWAGSLTYEQEQRVIAMANELPFIDDLRHQDRVRRQHEFLELMKLRANRDAFLPRLTRWLLSWEEGRAPEYERALDGWWAKRVDFFVAVDRLLTPHQRAVAVHRVQDYIEDFTRLAERPDGRTAAAR